MVSTENHLPDVNPPKHSLLPTTGTSHNIPDMRMKQDPPNYFKTKPSVLQAGIVAVLCHWIVQHQIGLAINLLLLHALTHLCFPRARQTTRKYSLLSYYNPNTGQYALGWDDFYMVIYSIVVLTGLRAGTMDYILLPLAQVAGVRKKKDQVRFAEQGWVLIYDTTMWILGMYIMYTHEHWLNLRGLWTGWPHREFEGTMKWYYLVQFAFWLQQILVVNIEERRKDHWQMFTHHIITCTLMLASYAYHQTRVGNMILCLMDVVDLFLALAKILKYLQYQLACDMAFGVFMLVWLVTRHFCYLTVVYSVYSDIPKEIRYGCYSGSTENLKGPFEPEKGFGHLIDPFRDPKGVVCFNDNIKWAFIYTLMALQAILCAWFVMIVNVALKVLRGGDAEDVRSDDEDDEGEEEEEEMENPGTEKQDFHLRDHHRESAYDAPPIEEEVDAESLTFTNQRSSPARKFRKSGGMASGVNLHSDRKELLGRIGCDKQPD